MTDHIQNLRNMQMYLGASRETCLNTFLQDRWDDLEAAIQRMTELEEQVARPNPVLEMSDPEIDQVAESLPGGLDGFMKGWGWRHFAKAILNHLEQRGINQTIAEIGPEKTAELAREILDKRHLAKVAKLGLSDDQKAQILSIVTKCRILAPRYDEDRAYNKGISHVREALEQKLNEAKV